LSQVDLIGVESKHNESKNKKKSYLKI
jgi:hypothetical protein